MAYSRAIGKVRSPSPLRQEIARAESSDDEARNRRASTGSDVQRRLAAQRVFGGPPPPVSAAFVADDGSLWMFEQSEEVQEQHIEYSVDLLDAAEGLWEIEEAKLGGLESPVKQGAPRRTIEQLPTPKGPRTAGSSQPPPEAAPTSPRKVSNPKPLTFNARPLPALPPATVTTPVPRRSLHRTSIATPTGDPPSVGAIARQGQAIRDMIAAVVQPRPTASSAPANTLESVPVALGPADNLVPLAPLRRSASVTSTTGGNDDLFERRQRDARKNIGIDLSNQSSSSPPEIRPVVAADLSRPLAARLARSTSLKSSDSSQSIAAMAKEAAVTAAPCVSTSTKAPPGTRPRPLPAPPAAASGSTLARRPSVNPLDSFNRLGRSQSLKSSRPSLAAPAKKADELLKPTRSFGPAQKSAPVVPGPSSAAASKVKPVIGNAASRIAQRPPPKADPEPPSRPTDAPAPSTIATQIEAPLEPKFDHRVQPVAAYLERPVKRPQGTSGPTEAPPPPIPADLAVTSRPATGGPSCSTPFRRSGGVPLPPDTIRQSAPRPKRNVPRSTPGRSQGSSSEPASSSSPRAPRAVDALEGPRPEVLKGEAEVAPFTTKSRTSVLDATPRPEEAASSAAKITTLGLGLPPASVRRTPSLAPTTEAEQPVQVKRKPSVRFTIALAAPEDPPVPAKSPGKRAASQPVLTVPKTFSFAAPRSASAGGAASGQDGAKASSREMAAIKAEEKLKAKRDGGPTIGSGGGWGRPSVVAFKGRTAPEEEDRAIKRVRSEAESKPLPKPAVARRTTSGGTGLYGGRPRLPSEHMRRPTSPAGTDADAMIRDAEGDEVRAGNEKDGRVGRRLAGRVPALESDGAHDDDAEVSALLCPPAPSLRPPPQQHLEAQTKQVPRKVSATHHRAQVGPQRKVSSSTTVKVSDVKRVVSAGSTSVLMARKASAEVKRLASAEKAMTTTTTGVTRSLSSVNFQKRLSQWREVESRRPSAALAPRPSIAIGGPRAPAPAHEWADVSLVHHVLPVKAAQPDRRPDFGFATDKRRRERELFELEKQARDEAEREKRQMEVEARRRQEEEELRQMRRLKVPMANPVPDWYRSS